MKNNKNFHLYNFLHRSYHYLYLRSLYLFCSQVYFSFVSFGNTRIRKTKRYDERLNGCLSFCENWQPSRVWCCNINESHMSHLILTKNLPWTDLNLMIFLEVLSLEWLLLVIAFYFNNVSILFHLRFGKKEKSRKILISLVISKKLYFTEKWRYLQCNYSNSKLEDYCSQVSVSTIDTISSCFSFQILIFWVLFAEIHPFKFLNTRNIWCKNSILKYH